MSVGSWNVLSQRSSLSRVAYSACGFLEGLRLGACQWPANGQQGKLQSFICEQDVISALIIARQALKFNVTQITTNASRRTSRPHPTTFSTPFADMVLLLRNVLIAPPHQVQPDKTPD